MKKELTTPVLFLIFNRPDTTRRVFNEIRKAKPKRLFVGADGPRKNREDDIKKCRAVRDVIGQVDWDCKVKTLFREKNLGCKIAVSSAIDWFFGNVEEGIILEDDCLPAQSFFWFCQELLEYYREDSRVMQISGVNFQNGIIRGGGSYYFTKYNHVWGWASWRRAWLHYDVEMKTWPKFKEQKQITNIFEDKARREYWLKNFQAVYEGKIDTWDFQWTYAIWSQNGLATLPNVNLVSNIGFGGSATHTADKNSKVAFIKMEAMQFPLFHPTYVLCDMEADKYTHQLFVPRQLFILTIFKKIKHKIKNIIKI